MPYVQVNKVVTLAPTGQPGSVVVVELDVGMPYFQYCAWVAGSATNVSVQPLFGGLNDGSAFVVNTTVAKKVLQTAVEELRPATTGLVDGSTAAKSALQLTNTDSHAATLTVMLVART